MSQVATSRALRIDETEYAVFARRDLCPEKILLLRVLIEGLIDATAPVHRGPGRKRKAWVHPHIQASARRWIASRTEIADDGFIAFERCCLELDLDPDRVRAAVAADPGRIWNALRTGNNELRSLKRLTRRGG